MASVISACPGRAGLAVWNGVDNFALRCDREIKRAPVASVSFTKGLLAGLYKAADDIVERTYDDTGPVDGGYNFKVIGRNLPGEGPASEGSTVEA